MSTTTILVDANVSVRPVFRRIPVSIPPETTPPPTPPPITAVSEPTAAVIPVIGITTVERDLGIVQPQTSVITATSSGWRRCSDGSLNEGTPPTGFIEVLYSPNDTCWEPSSVISFEPSLSEALTFAHQRGGGTYPEAKQFRINNASDVMTFQVNLVTNSNIVLLPSAFNLAPKSSRTVTVTLTPTLLEELADGISTIDMVIEIKQVI